MIREMLAGLFKGLEIQTGTIQKIPGGSNIQIHDLANGSAANDAVNKSQLDLKIDLTEKGANSGVATLDSGGKIPASQLPNSVVEFKGNWNASTNSPTLADGTGNNGDVYRANVAGTQNLGSGAQTFVVGDWVMYNGAIWQLSHTGADAVLTVNGQAGVVVLDAGDIGYDNTTSGLTATTTQAAIDEVVVLVQDVDARVDVLDAIVIKKDGSVDFEANQSMGGNKLTDLDTPTDDADAVNKLYVDSAITASSGANTALSNLTTTSINQSLLPNGDETLNLGSASAKWNTVYGLNFRANSTTGSINFGSSTININAATTNGSIALNPTGTGTIISNGNLHSPTSNTHNLGKADTGWKAVYSPFFVAPDNVIAFTGDTTSASAVVAVANTSNLYLYMDVFGSGIPQGAFITAITTNVSITLNTEATATATGVSLTAQFAATLQSADRSGTNSTAGAYVLSGIASGTNGSGAAGVFSGEVTAATGLSSGPLYLFSGNLTHASNNNNSGDVVIGSGSVLGTGASGNISISSGAGANRGTVSIEGSTVSLQATAGGNVTLTSTTSSVVINADTSITIASTNAGIAISSGADLALLSGANGNIQLFPDGTGFVEISKDIRPSAHYGAAIGTDSLSISSIRSGGFFAPSQITTFTGDTTNASATIAVTNTTNLFVNMEVVGTGIPVGATIASVVANTSITLDQNATASGTGVSFKAVSILASRSANMTGSDPSAQAVFRSGNVVNATSGSTTLRSGNSSGTGGTGALFIRSGDSSSATGGATGSVSLRSGAVSNAGNSASSGGIFFNSGNIAGSGNSGTATFRSGTTASGVSGNANYGSGNSTSGTSGTVFLGSGSTGSAGNSGDTVIYSGPVSGSGNSGGLQLSTGSAVTGASGAMGFSTGNVTSGTADSGYLTISTGTSAGGNRGFVQISAKSVNIIDQTPLALFNAATDGWSGFVGPATGGAGAWVLPDADGTAGQVLSTNGALNLSWVDRVPTTTATWTKVSVSYTNFATAALTNSFDILQIGEGRVLQGVVVKHSTAFTGGAISAYTVSVGITGDVAKHASAFDVFQAPGNTVGQTSSVLSVENFVGAVTLYATATSVGANLDAATAGSVDIWLLIATLP